ncbi:MAG: metalloregulator ArsR/SmtB family transcription factor [Clostridium tyrobutyricum]|jgi:ArsR family transcriptional regulator|uniref:ArsR/SmtB family transcription factor n=1 Tax=Clostridium tyrobutyricum TaxID=1519 RepID=UPI00242AF7B6|nr:metalloregulator ArsR/SmtB family transcription factor [Clostridium tyrobutyricum]MCH4201115.1 metalloregulator ArsR/SmtB family transcription factor [Clostridium tyrobutyricum]MCH4238499.1 metalloregulator ArsR/SmtB family transcription factor [Clostridium tyrobutyricum]MCH4260344.1 metalloregulator ArsR/SmtB family transcription factor [Clostridium tyrobutyricum]
MNCDKENIEVCSCNIIHEDIVNVAKENITNDTSICNMAEFFKVLNDPTRLKIINALMLSEMCVCDICAVLGMSQPAISHHLKVLRQTKLIKYRRDGKITYYSLDDEHIKPIFNQCLDHVDGK